MMRHLLLYAYVVDAFSHVAEFESQIAEAHRLLRATLLRVHRLHEISLVGLFTVTGRNVPSSTVARPHV